MPTDNLATHILNRIKQVLKIDTDKALAERMNIPLRRMQTWKHRNTVPYREIIDLCQQENLDLNRIFLNKTYGLESQPTHLDEPRTYADICAVSNCIRPPICRIEQHQITSKQIVDTLHINAEWAQHALGLTRDNMALIRVIGNNMAPWVSDGDLVLIDLTNTVIVADAPYVLAYDSILVVKRLVRQNDGTVTVRNDSHYCDDETFPPDTKLPPIIGRVIRRFVR